MLSKSNMAGPFVVVDGFLHDFVNLVDRSRDAVGINDKVNPSQDDVRESCNAVIDGDFLRLFDEDHLGHEDVMDLHSFGPGFCRNIGKDKDSDENGDKDDEPKQENGRNLNLQFGICKNTPAPR